MGRWLPCQVVTSAHYANTCKYVDIDLNQCVLIVLLGHVKTMAARVQVYKSLGTKLGQYQTGEKGSGCFVEMGWN